jgi:hypothetical protein
MDEATNLYKFITNNEELEKLEAKLEEFNPLSILKMQDHEIRHSNVLSWLINPKETHKFGDKLFKKLICDVLVNPDNQEYELSVKFNVPELQMKDFSDTSIRREWKHIDLLAVSPKNKFALLIENKMYAREKRNQLKTYIDIVKHNYPDYDVMAVFLTLSGDPPSEGSGFCTYSHEGIHKVVKFAIELYKDNMNQKVYDFIYYYLKTLEAKTMEDKEIKELCRRIYKQHKEALDLINKYSIDEAFEPAIEKFKKTHSDIIETYKSSREFWFVSKEIQSNVPKRAENWRSDYPIAYWFRRMDEGLKLILEVGPFNDPDKRINFMKHLEKEGWKFLKKALTPESKYTRLFSKYLKYENSDDEDVIFDKMNNLYSHDFREVRNKINNLIKTFDWK